MDLGAPHVDFAGTMTRFASPVQPVTQGPLEGTLLALVVTALIGLVIVLVVVGRGVGVDARAMAAFLIAAPLVSHESLAVYAAAENATVAVNHAGFTLPVLLVAWFLVSGRLPPVRTALAVAVVTVIAYASSYAVPYQGVLLHYRLPVLVAGGLGVLLAWGRWERAGPIAFTAGAGGVIVGADFFRIHELVTPTGNHYIILGGAGVIDGIFIVAVLAVVVAAFLRSIVLSWQRYRAEVAGAPPPAGGGNRGDAGSAHGSRGRGHGVHAPR